MNKELINKYKPEFDHWLNEGEILKASYDFENSKMSAWYKVERNENWNFSNVYDYRFIINDEYSEFRKALAEGKIIQINNSKPETWIDIDTDKLANYNPSFLRIKPDEPKFKVGDFVRVTPKSNRAITNSGTTEFTGIIRVIDKYNLCNIKGIDNTDWFEFDDIQLWTPVKDEWCWFYDNPNKDKYCNLSQFGGESNGRCFKTNCGTPWNFCEPFLNSLPSYLKDK